MHFRIAAVASVLFPAALAGQAFEYAAGTAQYRITQKTTVSQEMMGQKQSGDNATSQLLTVTLARASKDTIAGTLVLDSISTSNTMGAPTPSLTHLFGLKVTTRMSPSGAVVYSVDGPKEEDVPNASQLTTGMGAFIPKIRGRLTKGSTWVDTTTGSVKQFGIELDRKVVSNYQVIGDTAVGGETAWSVARVDSATVTGNGVGQGGPMSLEGASTTKVQFYVTPRGVLVGADGTEEGNVRIVLSSNGMEINVTTSSTTKVQRVK